MSPFPQLLSDEEFAHVLEQRGQAERHRIRDNGRNASAVDAITEPSDGLPESTIEQRFMHVAKKLAAMWPSEACRMYLHSLIVSQRDARLGFPPSVLEDLLMLSEINDRLMRGPGTGRGH
jgi:hypothetical protein